MSARDRTDRSHELDEPAVAGRRAPLAPHAHGQERPRALFGTSILALQRSAGNAAVGKLLRQEEEQEAEEGQEEAEGETITGTVEEILGEEISTRGCDAHDHGPRVPKLPGPSADGAESGGTLAVRANLTFAGWAHHDASLDGTKADAVAGHLTVGSQVTKGGASPGGGEFGVEKVKYKVDTTSWTIDTAKKVVDVNTRMFLDIGWGVHSLGRKDVSSENDAAVKKETYSDIVSDLTPDGSGRPTRDKYWCQDLTERHEQFHASDDIQRAQLYTPTAEAWLSTQTLTPPKTRSGLFGKIRQFFDEWGFSRKVKALLETARGNVEADGWAWYGAGGENRAYADGKSSYQARADAVSKRATDEGW
jgi:hypothetical protein